MPLEKSRDGYTGLNVRRRSSTPLHAVIAARATRRQTSRALRRAHLDSTLFAFLRAVRTIRGGKEMAKKALAVGISSYGFPNELPNCVRDAEAFSSTLETIYRFDQVRLLKDAEATREGIDQGLALLCD